MIALCREKAEREGLSPTLFVHPMHELDPPRTYRTIYVCGGFGLGSDRDRDAEALNRFYENLEAGGTLVLDNENPYSGSLLFVPSRSEGLLGDSVSWASGIHAE